MMDRTEDDLIYEDDSDEENKLAAKFQASDTENMTSSARKEHIPDEEYGTTRWHSSHSR